MGFWLFLFLVIQEISDILLFYIWIVEDIIINDIPSESTSLTGGSRKETKSKESEYLEESTR